MLGTGRTYWESVNKEGSRNHGPVQAPHRTLRRLQELVFMRFDVHTVRDLHDQRTSYTWGLK